MERRYERLECERDSYRNRRARPHHILPESGWVTVPKRTAIEVQNVVELFLENYTRYTSPDRGRYEEPVIDRQRSTTFCAAHLAVQISTLRFICPTKLM